MTRIVHYFDYKSPRGYLAQEPTFELARDTGVEIEWLPYVLDIPKYLGPARLDETGKDTVGERNDHQWRRVRYQYMDCRRAANRRGLVIRGPRRIFDSSIANIGYLYARERGHWHAYHDAVYERFFRRELDIEQEALIAAVLEETGIGAGGFSAFLHGPGRRQLQGIIDEAHAAGVFGVPSYLVDGELFWGLEQLPHIRDKLRTATPALR